MTTAKCPKRCGRIIVTNDIGETGEEAVVVCIKVLSGLKKNMKT
jgi:hypothetical protein